MASSPRRYRTLPAFWIVIGAALCAWAQEAPNLLKDPGFEEGLAPAWEKRTPDDDKRKLDVATDISHSGKSSAVLENMVKEYTRLRQGSDHSIAIPTGSLVELSAWVKSDLSDGGIAMVQLYCMGEKDTITGQFAARTIKGRSDWIRTRCLAVIPAATTYCMAYLEIKDGIGKAFFDDVALQVLRGPRPTKPAPRVGLVTDLSDDDLCLQNLKILFEDGLTRISPETAAHLAECVGAAVLVRSGDIPAPLLDAVLRFAEDGHPVFMDIRSFARWQGLTPVTVDTSLKGAGTGRPSLDAQMAMGLRVVRDSQATSGFTVGDIVPRAGANGALLALPKDRTKPGTEVLAVGPGDEPALVRQPHGKGSIVAADVLSLREPYYSQVDAYYKYLFLTNHLTNPVAFGQYYPKRYKYAEFVELMKRAASDFPAIRFQEEGPACGDYRLYSLNLGREGAPLYFLYAAAHGSEWEPGYGLLTFARRVAEGRMKDAVDLDRVSIKIVPFLNPFGYDKPCRQNANGVDLNRQGDYLWSEFQGTPKTKGGKWEPGCYDWKGAAPFCEPEAQTYKRIVEAPNLYCLLDYHGNTSATSNKVGVLPPTARDDNELRAFDMQSCANDRLRGRFILKQTDEPSFSPYRLDRVYLGGPTPLLMNTGARGRHGILVELTAGYGSSYGTVLQTDVTCEICRALFIAYPPPK